ncbi:MAG: hypothetical protein ACRD8U_04945 [Pyrinomonadaceae bacterium]
MSDAPQNSHKEKTNDQAKAKAAEQADQKAGSRKVFVLSNFLIFAFGSVGLVLIGLAINYHTKEGGYHSVKLALLWGIIGYALFGVALYFAYYEYVVEAARGAERARQKAETERALPSERPELFVESVYPEPFVAGQPNRMRVQIANRGKVTAHQVKLVSTHAVLPSSFKGPLIYVTEPPDTSLPIGSGASFNLVSVANWKLTPWLISEISAERAILFFYGKGTYQDEGGRHFSFKFCTMFKASLHTVVMCPDMLWPKERSEIADAKRPVLAVEGAKLVKLQDGRGYVEVIVRNSGQEVASFATVHTGRLKADDVTNCCVRRKSRESKALGPALFG